LVIVNESDIKSGGSWFVDDTLILCEANIQNIVVMTNILKILN